MTGYIIMINHNFDANLIIKNIDGIYLRYWSQHASIDLSQLINVSILSFPNFQQDIQTILLTIDTLLRQIFHCTNLQKRVK